MLSLCKNISKSVDSCETAVDKKGHSKHKIERDPSINKREQSSR